MPGTISSGGKNPLEYEGSGKAKNAKSEAAEYRGYAKKFNKSEIYQGASGKAYSEYGAQPKKPKAVQREYNLRVAKEIESRAKPAAKHRSMNYHGSSN